jgi:hypothetical protein
MENKKSYCNSNKGSIWSLAPKGPRHQDELADYPSVVMWLLLRMSKIVIVILIYHHHKPIDSINLLGS